MGHLFRIRTVAVVLGVVLFASAPRAQQAAGGSPLTVDAIADRVVKAEAALTARMRAYHPIVEVYIQNLAPDRTLGSVPTRDEYFLGQFDGRDDGPKLLPLSPREGSFHPASVLSRPFSVQYLPDGFASATVADWRLLTRERYQFSFVRREFLGEARCLVFDVQPRGNPNDGFTGRIWVEDRNFNIVRFNGISRNVDHTLSSFFRNRLTFHVDSWRTNVFPGFWVPSYVYLEETDLSGKGTEPRLPRIKAQIRLWGYELKGSQSQGEFAAIQLDDVVVDSSEQGQQLSPVQSQRRWEQQAEDNVIDRLSKSGFLAPVGPVDEVLDTVVNNLLVTSNIRLEMPIKCRILLTSPLETFTVGRTIVISRGLIDVLPDEASLAMVLGHELSHIVLDHQLIDTKFAFADRLMIPDADLLKTLRFRHPPVEELAADVKVVELLKQSPYKEKLAGVGLFLRAISEHAKQLPNLIQPHMGEYIVERGQPLKALMQQAPALAPERLDQIPALPLGARLIVDPWTDRLDLIRTQAVPIASAREKVPLSIMPLMPYIKYAESTEPH